MLTQPPNIEYRILSTSLFGFYTKNTHNRVLAMICFVFFKREHLISHWEEAESSRWSRVSPKSREFATCLLWAGMKNSRPFCPLPNVFPGIPCSLWESLHLKMCKHSASLTFSLEYIIPWLEVILFMLLKIHT